MYDIQQVLNKCYLSLSRNVLGNQYHLIPNNFLRTVSISFFFYSTHLLTTKYVRGPVMGIENNKEQSKFLF